MAFLEVKNIRIAGISAGVPQKVVSNLNIKKVSNDYDAAAFVEVTGVKERHYDELTVSDLAVPAVEKLLSELGWSKEDVDGLFVVTQHGDYIVPATSCIIQDVVGLSKECAAMDISLGCSGWVYGLSAVAGMMNNGMLKKCLLWTGPAN